MKKTMHKLMAYLLIALMVAPGSLMAAPIGANVVAGNVNINQQANTTQIQQLSNKTIINWQSFDISAQELVKFLQPGADSIALNRIVGGNATEILGQLSANGRIFILNPNGVVFGSTARVDVSGLLASTLNINDQDFLNNKFNFTEDSNATHASILNQGEIKVSDGGFAFLVAPGVKNEGLIVARLGQVALASGNQMTIDFQGNGLVSFAVSGEAANKVNPQNGQTLAAQVSNSGVIQANGGQVIMKGSSIGDAFTSVVSNTGTIQAQSLQKKNGKIILSGGTSAGIVSNSGLLDVSGLEANTDGGHVVMSGHFTGHEGVIKASGQGLGNGGLVQLNSAQHTVTTTASSIDVSGGDQGNGGTVLLRSDNHVTFDGKVVAKGGSTQGDGGFVDVSSTGQVDILGQVDASAAKGKTGSLLIDPQFIEINDVGGLAFATTLNQFAQTVGGTTIISATSINTMVANVILQANTDITVNSAITITNPATTLTLQAGRSILVNKNITTTNGAIVMTANDVGAVVANRLAGAANITMAANTTIDAGTANITLTIDAGVAGAAAAGGVQVDSITTDGNLTINSVGAITETVADAAVDLRANVMTLNTTAAGATIGSPSAAVTDPMEIHVGSALNISTTNSAVAVHSVGSSVGVPNFFGAAPVDNPVTTNIDESKIVDLSIDTINTGTATFMATVTDGAVLDARAGTGAAPNITAGNINIITDGGQDVTAGVIVLGNDGTRGGSIGTLANPLRTQVGVLSASSSNGSVYINEVDGVLINKVIAQQEGVSAQATGSAVTATTLSGQALTGSSDVVINAGGNIVLDTVTATQNVSITTTAGSILDNNQDTNNITAKKATLNATAEVGQVADAVDVVVENLSVTTTSGGVFAKLGQAATIDLITAGGAANDVGISNTQGALNIGVITAGGKVSIDAGSDSILDSNAAAMNITAASMSLIAAKGVGTAADVLETAVNDLSVKVSNVGQAFYIANTVALNGINATVNQGNANLTFTGGTFDFNTATNTLASSGIKNITFENTGGDIALGTVNAANTGLVNIKASGAINSVTSAVTADVLTLNAGTNIGAVGNTINTTVNKATLNATTGGIFVQETDGLAIDTTAGGAISVASTTGDITVNKISSTNGAATLTATAGSILSGVAPATITATSATLSAGTAIGSAASALSTQVGTLDATASGGGLFIKNSGDLILTKAIATGAALQLDNTGTLALGNVSAVGNNVTITSSGAITDNNAATTNITANILNITATSIGAAGNAAIDINASKLTASSTSGAMHINSVGVTPLALVNATATGASADINIQAAGNIDLGLVSAKGSLVTLNSAGSINDANAAAVNITADKVSIAATGGVGVGDTLETQVTQLTAGANSNIKNSGPLAITKAGLIAGGSSFTADSITILDMGGTVVALPVNTGINLVTTTGNIVFLNKNDTLATSGTGAISMTAGTVLGSGAVAALGNLQTFNQNISIQADSHISVGLLNAGTANVSLTSTSGSILDNNGALNNIIANNVTMSGIAPSARTTQLYTIDAIGSANAKTSEVAATLTTLNAHKAATVVYTTADNTAKSTKSTATSTAASAKSANDSQQTLVHSLQAAKFAADLIAIGLGIAADIAEAVAAPAQAIPMSGDGGTSIVATVLTIASHVASAVSVGLDIGLYAANVELGSRGSALDVANANTFAATQDAAFAASALSASSQAQSITQAAYDKAVIARDAAWQVRNLAVLAENTASTAGTLAQPFGIQATGNIDVAAQNSDVSLSLTGGATLGNISANKADGTAFASLISNQNINAVGAISANDYIHLETTLATGIINAAAPASLTAKNLVTIAGAGVGNAGALNANVDVFAANAGTGGVALINQKALTIGVVDGVTGVTAAQAVTIFGTGGMTVANNVTSSAANVILDAGTGVATVDNLVVNAATTVNGATGVTLNAGDNVTLTAGSQVTGTNVVVAANRAGDGIADTVTGSVVLAGNINGSTVTVSGGGVNQTGNIVSTGTVSVSANSAPSSAIQGISLGSVQAGGQVDVLSSNALTLTQNVTSTAGPINLTAGNSAATGDDLTVNANVIVNSGAALTLNSGDNTTIAAGSQLTGTAITMNADTDGAADGVTGSTVLAGNVNGTTVNMTSGGLNHTGIITSAGLVNIAVTSTASSAIQGIRLATILAGGVVDVLSSNALTLTKNVSSTGGAINLSTANNVGSIDNLTVNAVTVTSNVGVNMTSGDNVNLVAGSQVNGTNVVIKADNAGDGFTDTLSGGVTLAGNINSSTLTVTGGGLNQTGVITTTGLVNLTATSTANSAIQGMSLATINAGGSVDALSSNALTLTKNVTSTAGPMNLTAGNSAAVGDDLTVNANVLVNSGAALTMNAGDNMTVALGSQLTGTAIVMNADTDGVADGVTGSTVLAGNVTATTLNMTGGGLSHTGTISTTGLVNIAANSTVSSAIQGISLATILAGGVIDVVSNHALTLTQNVTSTTGPINLTASNSAAVGDNLTVNANVAVSSGAALNLNAGDNITTGLASTLTGTAIVLGADREGVAVADGVTGSLNLAGNITGSSLNITGGGLNHTGTITTTGLVNIAANSTATSAVQGISLATVLAGGVIDVVSNHALTLTQNVTSTTGPINFTAANSAAVGDDFTLNANVIVKSAGALTINAGDHLTTATGSQLNATAITMAANLDGGLDTAVGNVNLLGTSTGSSINITGGGLNQIGTITSTGPVTITTVSALGSVTNGISLGLIQAAGQNVSLSATGTPTAAILDNNDIGGLPALNIQAANLSMIATGGVGSALNAIETGVLRLAASGNAGGVNVGNTGNLTLGAVGAVPNVSATAGAINVSTVGNLAISNAAVQGAGLNVSLTATGGSITEVVPGLAADIVAANLNLNVTGVGSTIGTVAQRLEIDATSLNASTQGGSIYLGDTAGGLSLGLVSTTQALGSIVDLLVTGGSLTQLATAVANTASVISDTMNFAVTGVASTIGTANQYLNVDAITLGTVVTQGGDIFMVDSNGGVMIDQVSTLGKVGSKIALTSLNGNILESVPADLGLEFNAGTVSLQVNAPNTNIGTPLQPLEILASNIILNNLWGLRSFINVPVAGAPGTAALPAGQLNVPQFLPVVNTPAVPSYLMLVGGNVVGGTNVAAFTQAQSSLSSTVMPSALVLVVPNAAIPTTGNAAFALANLIGSGGGYWGSAF